MILEKVQHYLSIVFIIGLSLMYGLVFVSTRAQIITNPPQLNVLFVEPVVGTNIEGGSVLNFEATIGPNNGFTDVFFTLINGSVSTDFPADLQNNGNWKSISSWDTSQYPAGDYQVRVTAQTYQNGILVSQVQSSLQTFTLTESRDGLDDTYEVGGTTNWITPINNPQISEDVMDMTFSYDGFEYLENIKFNIHQVDDQHNIVIPPITSDIEGQNIDAGTNIWGVQNYNISALPDGQYRVIMEASVQMGGVDSGQYIYIANHTDFVIARTEDVPPETLQMTILSAVSEGDFGLVNIVAQANQIPSQDMTVEVKVFNAVHEYMESVYLYSDNTDPLVYSGIWDTAVEHDGQFLYQTDDYYLELYTVYGEASLQTPLSVFGPISVRNIEELPLSETPDIIINSPVPGSDIVLEDTLLETFQIDLDLSFLATNVSFDLYNQEDPSIGVSSSYMYDSGAGHNWAATVDLTNTDVYVPGIYNLVFHITKEDGTTFENEDGQLPIYSYNFVASQADQPVEENNIILSFYNTDSQIDRNISLLAGSDTELDLTRTYFIFKNKANGELYSFSAGLVDWDYLEQKGINRNDNLYINYTYAVDQADIVGEAGLPSGLYDVWFQYSLSTSIYDPFAISNVLSSVQIINDNIEENITFPADGVFRLFEPKLETMDNRKVLLFPFLTGLDSYNLQSIVMNTNGNHYSGIVVPHVVQWSDLESFGIFETDYENISTKQLFYLYTTDENGNMLIDDGDYYMYIKLTDDSLQTDNVYFTITGGDLLASRTEQNIPEVDSNQSEPRQVASSSGGSVAINLYTSCIDVGISNEESCQMFRAMIDSLDDECIEQHIYNANSCEDYLNRTHVDKECQDKGIVDIEQCKDYLLETYGSGVECQFGDINACNDILRNKYLNRLVVKQKSTTDINLVLNPLLGQTITVNDLNNTLSREGIKKKVLPLTPLDEADTKVYVAKSKTEAILEDSESLTVVNEAVLMVDTDGDELSDDLEVYYGTDPNNPDTDGDSYFDGQEIANGYDPLGPGRLEIIRNSLEQAIANDSLIEQPRLKSKKIDKSFDIQNIDNVDKEVKLSGKAIPNTWINIFLYSDLPLVMTTKTDDSGNWVYDIKHSLADGHHRAYVTINDDTGKIVKQSNPISFLVKSAKAVTADDYFDDNTIQDNVSNMVIYYIIGAALLIIIALIVIIFLHQRKNKEELGV